VPKVDVVDVSEAGKELIDDSLKRTSVKLVSTEAESELGKTG
jgi:hypothetical protein